MEKDTIQDIFKNLEGQFDVAEPAVGHEDRFLKKLNAAHKTTLLVPKENRKWLKPLSVAAAVAVVFTFSFFQLKSSETVENRVAKISPEASKTQFHFANLIEQQISELQLEKTPETEKIIADTMIQLKKLKRSYENLENDLVNGGNSKLILSAMITNFQTRIDLLNEVMKQIETIKLLKNTQHANHTI